MPKEKTAAELQAEEEAAKRLRGDIIDENNPPGDLEGDGEDDELVDLEEDDEEIEEPGTVLEDEEEFDEEEEPEEEEPPITIPKARFDEAQQKARLRQEELERRIREYESKEREETADLDTKKLSDEINAEQDKYEDLLMEGELEKARAVRRSYTQKQEQLYNMRLQQQSQVTGTAAVEQMRFDAQLAQFEAKFPAINPDSEDFNIEVAQEVNTLMNAFKADGYKLTAALNKAIHYVLRDDTPSVGEDPQLVRTKRSQTARKRVAKVVKKSPPDLSGRGRDSDKTGSGDGLPDINKLSQEQFDKLSEAELRALRGDKLSDEEVA